MGFRLISFNMVYYVNNHNALTPTFNVTGIYEDKWSSYQIMLAHLGDLRIWRGTDKYHLKN